MKILHINTYSEYGGAAIAAKRHCEAMRRAGLESKMLSLVGKENEYTQIVLKNSYDVKKWKWMVAYTQKASRIIIKKFAWHWTFLHYDISRYNIVNEADIIYVHWINDFLNMDDIKGLLKQGKTIVLFLHDMWPITGGCHYSLDCERYQSGCYNCPQMKSMKFLAVKQLKKRINKIKGYSKLHIVAPSRWLFNCISNSLVANKTSASISCIPNVIDVAKFIPMKKSESKEKLSLDSKRKYILFCAMDSANPYKGFKYLVDALSILENEEYEYIVMGKCDREDFPQLIRPKLHIMGFISKTEVLVDIYNASDILLH